MAWVWRGLREGIVTTRYPRRDDGYGPGYRGSVRVAAGADPSVLPARPVEAAPSEQVSGAEGVMSGPDAGSGGGPGVLGLSDVVDRCPTGAIGIASRIPGSETLQIDRGGCILCGRCVDARPDRFTFDPRVETAALSRATLVVPQLDASIGEAQALEGLRSDLWRRVKALRRSVHIRHVDAGSDGSEEWEVAALTNPVYDVGRLGIFFTASPRHADLLLVTGVGTVGMASALRETFAAMPEPKIVVAAGTDATSGGLLRHDAANCGVGAIVPVDVWVPGSPPSPFSILHGILLGLGVLLKIRSTQ